MKIKKSYLAMIRAFPGGWDAICGALGMSRNGLENRVYERKGQGVTVDTALQLQAFSGTTLFAEAVAASSGGTFVKLPTDLVDSNELLGKKFREVSIQFGSYASRFDEAIAGDDEIDARERADLQAIGDSVHKAMSELLALTFRVYCAPDSDGSNA
ncbi:hypothetical protein BA896_012630 [Janthinobacterium lividum]|uniref:DNA-binding protein n=1 Tax=Janthinobacterium lividum TaxID=29581 RepID=A0A1E8PTK8_9BURK|nr:hypothetical protein BA896_012630 [Janthinobacterium lividum]